MWSRDADGPMPDRRLRIRNTRRGTSGHGRTHHDSCDQPSNAQRADADGESREGKKAEHIISWHDRRLAVLQVKMERLCKGNQVGRYRQDHPTIGMLRRPAPQRPHQERRRHPHWNDRGLWYNCISCNS